MLTRTSRLPYRRSHPRVGSPDSHYAYPIAVMPPPIYTELSSETIGSARMTLSHKTSRVALPYAVAVFRTDGTRSVAYYGSHNDARAQYDMQAAMHRAARI